MRALPFHLQGKGVLDLDVAADISGLVQGKWKKGGLCVSNEPTSVLERRRSPSPPTSTSTLSTSLGGGSGSTDTAGVAAVSGNPIHQWPASQEDSSAGAVAAAPDGGSSRKEVWAPDLQPVPPALEMGSNGGGEKCSGGGGFVMEEWENMLSESVVSLGNEHSFFRYFMGDVDDPSLKHLLQSSGGGSSEFESGGTGFGVVEPGLGFEGGGVSSPANVNLGAINPPLSAAAGDFALNTSNPLPNFKGPFFGSNNISNPQNPIFSANANGLPVPVPVPLSLPLSLPQGAFYQQQQQQQLEGIDEKPQIFNPQLLQNQQQASPHQNPAFFLPLRYTQQDQQHLLPPQPKRYHPTILDPSCQFPKPPFADSGQQFFLQRHQRPPQSFVDEQHLIPDQRPTTMKVVISSDNAIQQAAVDQLFKVAELVEGGNFVHARGILARLNHQLPHVGRPLSRAAFYFKEALQLLLNTATTPPLSSSVSPLDVVFKISAYKVFSEISPYLQFVNFTSNQVLLEALDGFDKIHLVDFDIGIGGQWASFMQELSMRLGGTRSLKITAFVSSYSHHPLEINLTRENLTNFANNLNISFEFNVINLDNIEPAAFLNVSDGEVVAVNFPVGSSNLPFPLLLRLLKQLSPKIVVSVDHGCVRNDFPFSQHFLHALQSYSVLFDSLDAVRVNSDAVCKIERYLLQPRIESVVLGRHREGEKMPPWRALLASTGFSPLPFSNITETQGEYMVTRLQLKGFHVEKRQAALYLCWQRGELCSVSAWRC